MLKKIVLALFVGAFLLVACKGSSEKKKEVAVKKVFEPNWESIKKNYKDPEWFNKQKFGIFIHWGAYAVPAYSSEWYPRNMYMDTAVFTAQLKHQKTGPHEAYTHHVKTYGNPKEFGYKDFIPMFKAEKFNPKEWITLFKEAGAKYIVPVADHHDGFAMYKSNTTRWNSVDMGPKRDVLGELMAEGRKQGLIMGASSHFAFNWSFFNKKDHFDTTDPEYADLYSSKGKDLTEPVSEAFKKRWWERTKDLIDNYQPDILWFDFMLDTPDFREYRPKLAAYYYNKGIEWGKEVVLQDKNFYEQAFPEGTVVYDLERGKLADIRKLPWQTDTSIGKNSWSHVSNWKSKTTNDLLDNLIDIVSKNGNLLLNVGPKADGTIPDDQAKILLQMGEWLGTNGDAIYNTKYWRTFGEGPTEVKKGHHSEGKNKDFTGQDIRFTQSEDGTKLYAILMEWPTIGSVKIHSLGLGNEYSKDITVKSIKMLSTGNTLQWKQNADGLQVELPKDKPGDYAYVLELTL
ncbi:alpha-L-fucosidase [Wenyingzhuangia sp. 1_MG-2023]|nr:alpha-L-fucosidase [Wenyingzhuangia sp. 1_MG-2023]